MKRTPTIDGLLATSLSAILALCIVFHPCPARAGMQSDIDHLPQTIETSGCSFTRNGSVHDGQAAGEHIQGKYTLNILSASASGMIGVKGCR
jgi:hypothetical protein